MKVSTEGSVVAIATPMDSDPSPDLPMYAVLLDELNPARWESRPTFILLIEEATFAILREIELHLGVEYDGSYSLDAQSLLYR